jgi:mono/diheme cytochrome c family protein
LAAVTTFRASAQEAQANQFQRGEKIFQTRCVSCHAKKKDDDSPFGPPNLYVAFQQKPALSRKEAKAIIENGRNTMPGFSAVLTSAEIDSVITYLQKR